MAYVRKPLLAGLYNKLGLLKNTGEYDKCTVCGLEIDSRENSIIITYTKEVYQWLRIFDASIRKREKTETYCKKHGIEKIAENLQCPVWLEMPVIDLDRLDKTAINLNASIIYPSR